MEIDTTPELVNRVYKKLRENIKKYRKIIGRPLTLTEKILAGHLDQVGDKNLDGGKNYVFLIPDRVALQDVTGQMVMLQFMQAGLSTVIWDLMGDSVYQRVQSFTELALALNSVAAVRAGQVSRASAGQKLPSTLAGFLRSSRMDDEMRQFLVGAVEQLSNITEGSLEVPVSIIRALNDVERLAMLEESALPPAKQDALRCCILQIARLAGENG